MAQYLTHDDELSVITCTDRTGRELKNVRGGRKYFYYTVEVDEDRNDRAVELLIADISRPHMRAFHCSWIAFFVGSFQWFAIQPLLPEIENTVGLRTEDIFLSNGIGVIVTTIARLVLGPICDKCGPRVLFATVLCFTSIPTALTGVINDVPSFIVIQGLIAIAGSTFVLCQSWISIMFTREIAGTANAIAGGWGTLGSSAVDLVISGLLFPFFKDSLFNGNAEMAWRTVSFVPAVIAFATGIMVYRHSDDTPKGTMEENRRRGGDPEVHPTKTCFTAVFSFNAWILSIQYACCFGVELTMQLAAAAYFKSKFAQSQESAASISSLFGWMNLFSRGVGGYCSDKLNCRYGMKSRLAVLAASLFLEGILILIFSQTETLATAIFTMIVFSFFVQAAEGAVYAVVPYLNHTAMGAVNGIVGAGGSIGAVGFGILLQNQGFETAFLAMGAVVLCSSILTSCIHIKDFANLFCGEDAPHTWKEKDGDGELLLQQMKA